MKPSSSLRLIAAGILLASPWLLSSCATTPPAPAEAPPAANAEAIFLGDDFVGATKSIGVPLIVQRPESRPGLGTGWGAEVGSVIGYTSFARSSTKPKAVSTIYYNDKEGVAAMTRSRRHTGSGMQRAADGLVEWGVKGTWNMLKNYHSGSRRYVVGRKGSNYALVVKNLCHSRLEVVLSVDGLDVMDGRPASFKKRGYIIHPGKTLTVKGFRTSEAAVASFQFSSVSRSYSNTRHGTTRNVGVIGMAVFTPKGVDPWKWSRRAIQQRHGASPFAEAPHSGAR